MPRRSDSRRSEAGCRCFTRSRNKSFFREIRNNLNNWIASQWLFCYVFSGSVHSSEERHRNMTRLAKAAKVGFLLFRLFSFVQRFCRLALAFGPSPFGLAGATHDRDVEEWKGPLQGASDSRVIVYQKIALIINLYKPISKWSPIFYGKMRKDWLTRSSVDFWEFFAILKAGVDLEPHPAGPDVMIVVTGSLKILDDLRNIDMFFLWKSKPKKMHWPNPKNSLGSMDFARLPGDAAVAQQAFLFFFLFFWGRVRHLLLLWLFEGRGENLAEWGTSGVIVDLKAGDGFTKKSI